MPYIKGQLQNVWRSDRVGDVYLPESLKQFTRIQHGKEKRERVLGQCKIPQNSNDFLRLSEDKEELFSFLNDAVMKTVPADKVKCYTLLVDRMSFALVTKMLTIWQLALMKKQILALFCMLMMQPANCLTKLSFHTIDTDVVVLAVANVSKLVVSELWVLFGKDQQLWYLAAHEIAYILGPRTTTALPFCNEFTGCDTVSNFKGKINHNYMDNLECVWWCHWNLPYIVK